MQKTPPLTRDIGRLALLLAGLATACSGSDPTEEPVPTPEQTRAFYGLQPGSCYRYEIPSKGTSGRLDVTGPNTVAIAGRTVFEHELFLDTAERPYRWQIEADGEGQLRLLRWIEGAGSGQVIRRYENTDAPVFMRVGLSTAGAVELEPGARFEVQTTPEVCVQGNCTPADAPELHTWTVFETTEVLPTPDGEEDAVPLQYVFNSGAGSDTARYWLVPQKGFVRFIDFDGARHNICAWKLCDADGSCSTTATCAELSCT